MKTKEIAMSEKSAVVTNECDYAGPLAMETPVNSGFKVIGHDPSFAKADVLN